MTFRQYAITIIALTAAVFSINCAAQNLCPAQNTIKFDGKTWQAPSGWTAQNPAASGQILRFVHASWHQDHKQKTKGSLSCTYSTEDAATRKTHYLTLFRQQLSGFPQNKTAWWHPAKKYPYLFFTCRQDREKCF